MGRPGGLDTPGAAHAGRVIARSLPMVVGKRGGAQPGQSVVFALTDVPHPDLPTTVAVLVGDDGRARLTEAGDLSGDPTTTLRLDWVDWVRLGGGRTTADEVEVQVEGNQDLGRRVLAGMAVTP